MQPLYFTLSNGLELKILPDASVYHDGHPIISYTYSIFLDKAARTTGSDTGQTSGMFDYVNHPDYIGFITFEEPGSLFSYTAYSDYHLTLEESEELVERLTHFRDTPSLWSPTGNF